MRFLPVRAALVLGAFEGEAEQLGSAFRLLVGEGLDRAHDFVASGGEPVHRHDAGRCAGAAAGVEDLLDDVRRSALSPPRVGVVGAGALDPPVFWLVAVEAFGGAHGGGGAVPEHRPPGCRAGAAWRGDFDLDGGGHGAFQLSRRGHAASPATNPSAAHPSSMSEARRYPRPYWANASTMPVSRTAPKAHSAVGCPDVAANAAGPAAMAVALDSVRTHCRRRPPPVRFRLHGARACPMRRSVRYC